MIPTPHVPNSFSILEQRIEEKEERKEKKTKRKEDRAIKRKLMLRVFKMSETARQGYMRYP